MKHGLSSLGVDCLTRVAPVGRWFNRERPLVNASRSADSEGAGGTAPLKSRKSKVSEA